MSLRELLLDVAHPTFVAMTSDLAVWKGDGLHVSPTALPSLFPPLSSKHVYSQRCCHHPSKFLSFLRGESGTREMPAGTLAATSEV